MHTFRTTQHYIPELERPNWVNKSQIDSLRDSVLNLAGEAKKLVEIKVQTALNTYKSEIYDKLQNMNNIKFRIFI